MAQQYSYTYAPPMVMPQGSVQLPQGSMARMVSAPFLGHMQPVVSPWPSPLDGTARHVVVQPAQHVLSPRVVQPREQPKEQPKEQQVVQSPRAAKKAEAADASPSKQEAAAAASEQPPARSAAEQRAPAVTVEQLAERNRERQAAALAMVGPLPLGGDSPFRGGGSSGGDSPTRASSPGGDSPRRGSKAQRTIDLYQEAFSRKARLHTRQENAEAYLELEARHRIETFEKGMKQRRRLYRGPQPVARSHLEREAEMIRKRQETKKKKEAYQSAQQNEELRECTFRPKVLKNREPFRRALSPGCSSTGVELPNQVGFIAKFRNLAERQRMATAALRLVAADEAQLREELRAMHSTIHERFQMQETQRVVEMLKRNDASSTTHGSLIQRVQATMAAGNDPAAMQAIVAELVSASNQEIQRKTSESLEPKRLEAESELYERRVVLVKELEAVETEASELTALHPGSLQDKASEAGIELGIAEHALRSLPSRPGMSLIASLPAGSFRPHGTSVASSTLGGQTPVQQTPRSPGAGSSCSPVRDADPNQPVKRRLEFMEEYAAAIGRMERRSLPQVIVYR